MGPDARQDWHVESATMAQVYRGSFLNIAGAARHFTASGKDRLLAAFEHPKIGGVRKSNPFGAVTSGAWKFRTRLVPVRAVRDGSDKGCWQLRANDGRPIKNSKWAPDEAAEDPVALLLCLCVVSGESGMHGLIVAQVEGNDNEYVRTGVFELWKEDGDDDEEEEEEKEDEEEAKKCFAPRRRSVACGSWVSS